MPFAKFKQILTCADENKFAVASVNIFNIESASWVIKAAELERVPVIVMLYPDPNAYIPMTTVGAACRILAERATVPVGVHLDHSKTYEVAISGIPAGFQSIMIDCSALPLEENAAITRQVVETARIFNVEVEAELGYVGRNSSEEELFDASNYTDPNDVVEFVNRTGVDALAVAIGNSHGKYITNPHLDISRLDEINKAVSLPLVLHGGSGIPKEQLAEAVKRGINKVNYGTEFFAKSKEALSRQFADEDSFVFTCLAKAGEEVVEFMRDKLKMYNPLGYKLP